MFYGGEKCIWGQGNTEGKKTRVEVFVLSVKDAFTYFEWGKGKKEFKNILERLFT